jgi:hypothetical protein
MIAFRYAILRFLPFVETGEFANVGIVLASANGRYFNFKLLKRKGRVTNFFELNDNKALRVGLKHVGDELIRVKTQLLSIEAGKASAIFDELTRHREAVFRFDQPRAYLASDGDTALNTLFDLYVDRVGTKENQEELIEQGLRSLFSDHQLADKFRQETIGDDLFKFTFPFVSRIQTGVKVIKPLHLTHLEPHRAFDHGLQWAGRVAELKNRDLLDGRILFAVKTGVGAKNQEAASAVRDRMKIVGAEVVEHTATPEILLFANAA